MSNHYVWAGSFFALSIGGISYGAYNGVQAGLAAAGQEYARAETAAAKAPAMADKATTPERAPATAGETDREALRKALATAIFLGRQGEFAAAVAALETLGQKYPDQPAVWYNLGVARSGLDDFEGANQAFNKAIELKPDDYDAVAGLADVALHRNDLDAALELAETIPVGQGRLRVRLKNGLMWVRHVDDPRVVALRAKHGLPGRENTSERVQKELQERRRLATVDTTTVATTATSSQSQPSAETPSEMKVAAATATTTGLAHESAARATASSTVPLSTSSTGSAEMGESPSNY